MPKTVTASEAKNRLGALLGWVVEHHDEVIVESHGEPKAVIVAFDEYEKLKKLDEQQRSRAALASLKQLRSEINLRNQGLTPTEADVIADRLVRDVVLDMVVDGKVQFD
ncbi:MAG: hypothetical protein NVS4B8_29710 [Herpetosiphon sp.]